MNIFMFLALPLFMFLNPDDTDQAILNVGNFSGSDNDAIIPEGWESHYDRL